MSRDPNQENSSADQSQENLKEIIEAVSGCKIADLASAHASAAVDLVLKDYKAHFEFAAIAIARRKIKRVLRLFEIIDRVEDEILDSEDFDRIHLASNTQLINLLKATSDEVSKTLAMACQLAEKDVDLEGGRRNEITQNFFIDFMNADVNAREKLRGLVTNLLTTASKTLADVERESGTAEVEQDEQ